MSVNTELNGVIKATNLSLIQGGNSVDYHTGRINPVSSEAKETSPVVSVNGAGGITAENIRIVSTSESGNVKLKNIESVNNNIFIVANSDVTLSDKIKSGGNISVIAKNITIDSPAKIYSKDNITITTSSFLNKGNVVSEKDLRIFSGTVINQGDKAYVQSGGNLWIQKNATGDLSHNVTNESAILKSERGDLIIKTKKLANISNSNPTTSINIKANSTKMNSVGNSLHYLPEWRRHGLLVSYPKLKNFKYDQWFGSLDFLFNDSVNVERQAIRYKDDFKPAYISSGGNAYIVANEFDNKDSFLLTDDNMIITGKNARFRNHRTGILNLWERYEPEDKNNVRLHFDVEPDTTPQGIIVSNVETGYLLRDKFYTWTDVSGTDNSLISAGNIIVDFKDSISIQSTVPVVERPINEIHTDSFDHYLSADNIIINSDKITINSNIKSEKDLNILAYNQLDTNESTLIAGESMSLLADDINLKSTNINTGELSLVSKKGNILYSSGTRPVFTPGVSALPLLYAPKGIYGNSSGDITFNNIALTNTGRVDLSAQGNIAIGLDEKSLHGKKSLTLLSGGSILFQAAELLSDGVMNVSATGGYLYAQAMEETSHYEDKKKKCNRWTLCLTKKEITKIKHEVKNKVTEFTAGDDINLMARDNITLEATKISTNRNARLTSLSGQIKFKAVNDLLSEQIVSYSKGFYITHRNQYYDDSHWRLPSIHYGGKLSVDAADGITTDSKLLSGSDLKNSVTLLSQQQGLSWLKELTNRDDVQWNSVADAYNRRDIRTRRLNPVASAVLAVVVAAATSGSGLAAWAGYTASSGVSGAAGAVLSGAAHSGMVALTTRAAVALVENQGNLSATFKSLERSDSIKSMIGQMTVTGLLNGLDVSAGWQNGTPAQSQLPLLSNGDWYKVAQRVAAQSVISSVTDSVLSDTGFNDNFKNALLNNIGSQINAEGAKLIGDHGELLTEPGKAIAHSAVSAIRSELTNRSVRGAVTGALAASLAGIVLNDNLDKTAHEQEQQAQIARVMGAVSGLISTGHINGLTTAADTAEIVERYNRQFHLQELNAIDELSDGSLFKKERLLASGCRLINCTAQESRNSAESLRFNALMDKYPQTYLEDNLLTNYWVIKGNDIVGHYPRFDEKNKIKLFSYTENDKLADSDDFIKNQFSEYITEFTGLSKATADMVVDSISMSSSVTNGRGKAFKVQQHSNHIRYADLNQVYAINKSGNKVPMKWFPSGSGINQQGIPFEHYIGTQLPAGSKLPDNFKTFDFYDSKNKTAISVKTINTQTDSRLRKPNAIKYTINGHVNEIIKFKEHEKSRMKLTSDMIDKKSLYIGLPEKTTKEQWEGINSAIKNAHEKNVDIKITIIKGE